MTRLQLQSLCAAIMLTAAPYRTAAAAKKSQVKPAQSLNQTIQVDKPYCDAYLPYTHNANGEISPILNRNSSDDEVNAFLNRKLTNSDDIPKTGLFTDPGFPLLGNPQNHFYDDGSDLTRVITRLTYGNETPLCMDATTSKETTKDVTKSQYFLLHVVRWQMKTNGGFSYSADNSQWYVFNKSDKKEAHRQFPFTFRPLVSSDLRMFGSSQVFFVAIHLAPQGSFSDFKALNIAYKMSVQKLEPINQQDLAALFQVFSGSTGAGTAEQPAAAELSLRENLIIREPSLVPSNPHLADYKALLAGNAPYAGLFAAAKLTGLTKLPDKITASLDVKFPPVHDPQNEVGVYCLPGFWDTSTNCPSQNAPAASGGDNAEEAGGSSAEVTAQPPAAPPPATTTSTGTGTSSTGCLQSSGSCNDKQTIQNEGLYWWDVGVGVPFNSYKDLQISSASVTTKTISRQTAYGFLILAPWREDFVTPPSLGIPHIMIGLPLSGKVLDTPFVGLGEAVNLSQMGVPTSISQFVSLFRFYAGLSENKTFGPAAAGIEPPHRWIGKFQYGIEFSIKDVASKLSGSGSN
jgi:hypothetical protein